MSESGYILWIIAKLLVIIARRLRINSTYPPYEMSLDVLEKRLKDDFDYE